VWHALFRTRHANVRGGSRQRPFSPFVPRGAGGGQERSRTRKRKCIESESHLHVCGLATINISHSGAVCEITKLAGPATHFPYLVRIRIGRSVGRRDSLTRSLTHSRVLLYMYLCTSCIAVCKCMQQRRHTKRDIYQNKLCALWCLSASDAIRI
jgi:hypothetical protein